MASRYQQWMYDWETRLTSVDNNRVVRPLEWGIEWTRDWPCRNGFSPHQTDEQCERYIREYNLRAVAAAALAVRRPSCARSSAGKGLETKTETVLRRHARSRQILAE